MKTAAEQGAQIILAQDPDSDRFSAIEAKAGGGWTTFTGDQLGVIFAASVFEKYKATGKPLDKLVMVASTVSSKMVAAMAAKEGFKFTETLTGEFGVVVVFALECCVAIGIGVATVNAVVVGE